MISLKNDWKSFNKNTQVYKQVCSRNEVSLEIIFLPMIFFIKFEIMKKHLITLTGVTNFYMRHILKWKTSIMALLYNVDTSNISNNIAHYFLFLKAFVFKLCFLRFERCTIPIFSAWLACLFLSFFDNSVLVYIVTAIVAN